MAQGCSGLHWRAGCICPDDVLICLNRFGGHSGEFTVWLCGSDTVARFNGVVVLGDPISPICVQQRNGRFFTDFNRTISGALANKSLLDIQGITEAINYNRD